MDWNNDGFLDLLVGEYNGHVKYFRGVTPDSLTEMDDLQAGGSYISGGLVSSPVVFDWDADSRDDLIVGFSSPLSGSTLKLYMNIGTQNDPILDSAVDVFCGGDTVNAAGCTPFVADLDKDGFEDILYGISSGKILFCRNIGTLTVPVFDTPELLQSISGGIGLPLNSSVCVEDWNQDGYPDLIAGCGETGFVFVFLSPYTTGLSHSDPAVDFSLIPLSNPVTSSLSLELNCPVDGIYSTSLFSIDGRLAQNMGESELTAGISDLHFSIASLPPGVYIVQASNGENVTSAFVTLLEQ